jgi:CDP-glucose 4,6-dehydratase
VETYAVNVMGTVHLLEAIRGTQGIKAVVNVTTDKCYDNREWAWGYREIEPLGGFDPYSSSKSCSELVTAAYRRSFFDSTGVAIATARAGNVIGGGDWANDRLVPDILRAVEQSAPVRIRNPHSIRPWQHVLEPLAGYLRLAETLAGADGARFAGPWNFGPSEADSRPVQWMVERMLRQWGSGAQWVIDQDPHLHEATVLKLDCSKARTVLGWQPKWGLTKAITAIVEWHKAYMAGEDARQFTLAQIAEHQTSQAAP